MRTFARSGAILPWLVLVVWSSGCGDDDAVSNRDAGGRDADSVPDAPMRDDGSSSPECTSDADCTAPMVCARAYCAMGRCAATGPDDDGDGHISAACPISPPGGFPADDCDDADNTRFPGNRETCDTSDDDCDPLSVGDRDEDMDGFVDYRCTNDDPETGETYFGEDCDDSDAMIAPRVPDGPTMNCDSVDNDCDGMADEGCACVSDQPCGGSPDGMHDSDPATCRRGVQRCADGVLSPMCEGAIGPAAELCDGERRDEDCDGVSNEPEVCECSGTETRLCGAEGVDYGPQSACRRGTQACATGRWGVCMDAVYPSAERCEGTVDENCDGTVDESCTCTMGTTRSCGGNGGMGICRAGMQTCQADGTWGSECVGEVLPRAEACDGSVDDDCNGVIDNGCGCSAGEMQSCGTGMVGGASICVRGVQTCDGATGTFGPCVGATNPGPEELCDATMRDEDCDGAVNEDCGVVQVCAGMVHACAVRANGRAACWGDNTAGQLGIGSLGGVRTSPTEVGGLSGIADIACGSLHTCALTRTGEVYCWGNNSYGQLATGTVGPPDPVLGSVATPTRVTSLTGVVLMDAGNLTTCVARSTGEMLCWGVRADGTGTSAPVDPTPLTIAGVSGPRDISVGAAHVCIVDSGGFPACWGANDQGQLGDGSMTGRSAVARVTGLGTARTVAAGRWHSCAAMTDGTAACWGRNTSGELGDGTTMPRPLPVTVMWLGATEDIIASEAHTCAFETGGTTTCWGSDTWGQLGDSETGHVPPTVARNVLVRAIDLGAGRPQPSRFSCAAILTGEVYCWGQNASGQLGRGTLDPMAREDDVPTRVVNLPW